MAVAAKARHAERSAARLLEKLDHPTAKRLAFLADLGYKSVELEAMAKAKGDRMAKHQGQDRWKRMDTEQRRQAVDGTKWADVTTPRSDRKAGHRKERFR